jgi:D-alanine-D-alanine ligase-like ATP-grasp enzyme
MKKVVGVLRGGVFENYNQSLKDGGKAISQISENLSDKWKAVDILIDKSGIWHFNGLPITPDKLMHKVDIVWNTIDSTYSKILEDLSIPTVGVSHFSKILKSKEILKEHIKKTGVKMPRAFVIPLYQEDIDGDLIKYAIKKAKEIHQKFSSPWIIKPLTGDRDVGTHVVKIFSELVDAVLDCVKHKKSILVEEFILGKNISVHSVGGFRGENIYHFPPVENKMGEIISPGRFSSAEKKKLLELAEKIYSHSNTSQYLKSNFILHKSGNIYLTHIEFHLGLDEDSCLHKTCESVGTKTHKIIEHLLDNIAY